MSMIKLRSVGYAIKIIISLVLQRPFGSNIYIAPLGHPLLSETTNISMLYGKVVEGSWCRLQTPNPTHTVFDSELCFGMCMTCIIIKIGHWLIMSQNL